MSPRFRVYTNSDVLGVELGAALKNVLALCCGVSGGMGLGDNTKALLMTRGMTEMARLGVALGGRKETFAGLSGMGDLIVTCTSMHSRNRRCGILVGQGKSVEEAMKEVGATVEGIMPLSAPTSLRRRPGWRCPSASALTGCCTRAERPGGRGRFDEPEQEAGSGRELDLTRSEEVFYGGPCCPVGGGAAEHGPDRLILLRGRF